MLFQTRSFRSLQKCTVFVTVGREGIYVVLEMGEVCHAALAMRSNDL